MNTTPLTDTTTGALGGGVTLALGVMPRGAAPETHWAAGPWCFAGMEDFFPDWEYRFTFAPEPLRDLKVLERTAKEAQALCVDSLPALAARLCPHSADLPASYWETLLTPWAIDVAKQIVERWQRVRAMTEAWGHLPCACPCCLKTAPSAFAMSTISHCAARWAQASITGCFRACWRPAGPKPGARKCCRRSAKPVATKGPRLSKAACDNGPGGRNCICPFHALRA